MTTVGRLKSGRMHIAGELNERSDSLENGLVLHYPLDGTTRGVNMKPILDYSTWTAGSTGSEPGFTQNGSTSENKRLIGETPWGYDGVLWESNPDGNNNADGGWNSARFPVDPSIKYRFTTWVNRKVMGANGSFYLGTRGYGGTSGVMNAGTSTINTNPYFYSGRNIPENEWVLVVGHVYPSWNSFASMDSESGIYNTAGEKIANTSRDFRWLPDTTEALHRSYLYYATDTSVIQQWYAPRVDICNGMEPTLSELIAGETNAWNYDATFGIDWTPEGMSVGSTSSNLIPRASQNLEWGGYQGATATYTQNVPVPEWQTINATRIQITGGSSVIKQVRSFVTAPESGRFFTASIRIKNIGTNPVVLNSNRGGIFETVQPGEVKYAVGANIEGNGATHIQIQIRAQNAGHSLDFIAYQPQIEELRHPTAFMENDRVGRMGTQLPVPRMTEYTVFGKFIPNSPYKNSTVYDETLNAASLVGVDDSATRGGFNYKYWLSGGNSHPYMDFYGSYHTASGNGNYHASNAYDALVPLYYAIRKSGSNVRMKVFQNGSWGREHSGTAAINVGMDAISFTSVPIWNGRHSDVRVYDRPLTDAELDRLVGKKLSLKKNGDMHNIMKEYDSVQLIEDQTKNIYNNTWRSMGLWNVDDKDLSRFVESNNQLGAVYFTAEVYITSTTYYPTRFEFTRENNTKGINQDVPVPTGGWKVGWNSIAFKATSYVDSANTPWDDMSRFELYRSGDPDGVDTSQSIRLKDVHIVKVDAFDKWMTHKNEALNVIELKEGEVF